MKPRDTTRRPESVSRLNGANPGEGLRKHSTPAVAIGSGFVALDVVISEGGEQHPRTWAGGTCGNVLAILAYLGWRTYPVATVGVDAGAERLVADLTQVGVDIRYIKQEPARRTPIVIERIRRLGNGTPRSRFVWTCPECGAWLPGYQAVVVKDVARIVASMPDPAVFFFDRVSRGTLDLATASAQRGALVVFEPSGVGDDRLFREALRLCHVLKYSRERLTAVGERLGEGTPLLEVETLGSDGLRFRLRGRSRRREWRLMSACSVADVQDTVGAGDWCTAGLIHVLGSEGAAGLVRADRAAVERALRLGQALAALTCRYEGARGGMYAMDRRQFGTAVKRILAGGSPTSRAELPDADLQELWRLVCRSCAPKQTRARISK